MERKQSEYDKEGCGMLASMSIPVSRIPHILGRRDAMPFYHKCVRSRGSSGRIRPIPIQRQPGHVAIRRRWQAALAPHLAKERQLDELDLTSPPQRPELAAAPAR
jgi:hypothetical protein